jgi:TolB-like protein
MAQYKAGEFDGAIASIEGAVEAGNESSVAFLYLGMAHESSENWSGARDSYSRYLDLGRSDPLKQEIRNRLQLIARNVLREQAQNAMAQEAELSTAAPTPRSVAIFPFAFNSEREEYQPLIYALADMMITDFAVSNALTVLERTQIQSLLDEMALTDAGYSDPGTGARAGRMLRAEHVLQGVLTTLGQDDVRVDADVLNIPRSASAGTVDTEDNLQNLFDLEKDLVFRTIRDVLNVELTPAEEQAIRENRAGNILAFLAYGRNYDAAAIEFQRATDLDPNFEAAIQAASELVAVQVAAQIPIEQIQELASTSNEFGGGVVGPPPATAAEPLARPGDPITTVSNGTPGTLAGASDAVSPTPTAGTLDLGSTQRPDGESGQTGEQRDPVQESQGQETVTSTATAQIRIVIRRPGGEDR